MPTVHPKQILSLHHVTEEELGGLGHSQRGSPAFLRDTPSSPLSVLRQCRTKGTQCSTVGAVPPPQGWVLVIATQVSPSMPLFHVDGRSSQAGLPVSQTDHSGTSLCVSHQPC